MTAFGETAATLPIDAQAARVAVEEQGGTELVVEALATMMTFESITRIVDATVRVDQHRSFAKLIADVVISFNKAITAVQCNRCIQLTLAFMVVVFAVAVGDKQL